ncbi:hypothetical protein R9X47_10390 [Wukongibacter baidiensis]|uniref:hypothetical protein n=1 Tax=Wukongibacter baidiensis TaxID=1723361 RepID=UPI003D7FEC82
MKNRVYDIFILAVSIVLAGVAIAFGVEIGSAIIAYARNPSLQEQILAMLRSGLLITFVPYFLLLITFLFWKCVTFICRQPECKKCNGRYYD